jgi:membrane protein DedA with SNARE-associated domain
MTLDALVADYGYPVLLGGALLEGETIVAIAGYLANRGYLAFGWVFAIAAGGGFIGDQIYFYAGRRHGAGVMRRFPGLQPYIGRVTHLIERYQFGAIFFIRFMYGLRTVGPIIFGMSRVSWQLFVVLNLLSSLVWAGVIAGAGYLFGEAVEAILKNIERYEWMVLAGLAALGTGVWAYHALRAKVHGTAAACDPAAGDDEEGR